MTATTRTPIAGPIKLTAGPIDGHNPRQPVCGNCAETEDQGAMFGISAEGVPGRICSDCAETHAAGPMLVALVEALEEIDTAAYYAPENLRIGLLALAIDSLGWLAERYADGRGTHQMRTPAEGLHSVDTPAEGVAVSNAPALAAAEGTAA